MAFVLDRKPNYHRHYSSSNKLTERADVSGTKRPLRYFCDHCKISGHSIKRCFKIHRYPNSIKFRKLVAVLVHSTADDNISYVENTGLTTTQFNILIFLLNKHKHTDIDD